MPPPFIVFVLPGFALFLLVQMLLCEAYHFHVTVTRHKKYAREPGTAKASKDKQPSSMSNGTNRGHENLADDSTGEGSANKDTFYPGDESDSETDVSHNLPDNEPQDRTKARRKSVFAESYDPSKDDGSEQIVHPKSQEEKKWLMENLGNITLFQHLASDQITTVVDAMYKQPVKERDFIMHQGDKGNIFYVIQTGVFNVYVKDTDGEEKLMHTYNNKGSFGELALLYHQPRAATIVAASDGILWAVDGQTFRRIVHKITHNKRVMYESLINNVPMLKTLEPFECANLVDALTPKTFKNDDQIIKQGEKADGMYFVVSGNVRIVVKTENGKEAQIPCLVIAVPKKSEVPSHSLPEGFSIQDKGCSKTQKRLKQRLSRISKKPTKTSKSLSSLDSKSELLSEVTKKRAYTRKSLQVTSSTKKESTTVPEPKSFFGTIIPNGDETTLKKRTYCRKNVHVVAPINPTSNSSVSASSLESCCAAIIAPETSKKKVYRKKINIPAVPHNTPVLSPPSDSESNSPSFLSQSTISTTKVVIIKRGPGRPRLTLPAMRLDSGDGEESTISLGSDKGSAISRRSRKSPWIFDSDDEDQPEEEVSEYERLRQKNIEENLKKLREIFNEQGLQFGEKLSDTPKKKKSYTRLPLPPPRPKSQRLETRRSFMPLDFSKLDEKLMMSEAAFMT